MEQAHADAWALADTGHGHGHSNEQMMQNPSRARLARAHFLGEGCCRDIGTGKEAADPHQQLVPAYAEMSPCPARAQRT